MNTEISVHKQCVKDLLRSGKDNLFVIPEYQRPYNWTFDQVDTLFDDLWNFSLEYSEDSSKTYFLGTVVSYYKEKEKTQEIIDGQQRITSLFLLLRAFYTKLTEGNEETRTKEEIYFIKEIEPTIWRTNKLTGEVDYKEILLISEVMNNEGNKILKNILETGYADIEAKDNYSKNYNRFLELFESKSKDEPMKIYNFIYAVLNQAILLPISAGSEDTALTIFSTLNDTGLPLSDADIFKAKIYSHMLKAKCDKELTDNFICDWKSLEDASKTADESIQSLFYYYMFYLRALNKDEKTTTPGLRKFFTDVKNIDSYLFDPDLLAKLNKILNIWLVINNRVEIEEESWSKDLDIIKMLDCLNAYPNEFWKYPVISYYLAYNGDEDFDKKFLLFLRRFAAFLMVTYLKIPTINAVKGDIMKLNVNILKTDKPSFNMLDLDSDEFNRSLLVPHSKLVRMILYFVAYTNDKQTERIPEKWEIEHIFPQKWHNNYITDVDDATIKEKIEHIGNKVPFEKKLNIEASNGYFGKKKEYYKESKISIVKELSESLFNDWGLNNIEARDSEIVSLIKTVLKKWVNDYDMNENTIVEKVENAETLAMIEKLRAQGYEIR